MPEPRELTPVTLFGNNKVTGNHVKDFRPHQKKVTDEVPPEQAPEEDEVPNSAGSQEKVPDPKDTDAAEPPSDSQKSSSKSQEKPGDSEPPA